ncbi:YraN family protein [Spirulina major CS-329]|jgi:putative endonuclease|uniref:YraN family protein n=1 Tax=Spirulina TaxID=1154 RepID=UPI00232E8C7B|nr:MULTISPECIES: YraN family protein [Spirulina]MDB9493571.1 YraN family protein [Spirulina subsalsa CS-330]MDB9503883.1 YraN family protein [Spirulina major CS-329]
MGKPQKQQDYWVGYWGEIRVQQWLQCRGWQVLHHRWRCRRGELDLVAQEPNHQALVFVEVKTRGDRNWDHHGLLAITPRKQAQLWHTAELFLGEFPQYSTVPCRFDLALVQYRGVIHGALTPAQVTDQFSIYDYLEGILS